MEALKHFASKQAFDAALADSPVVVVDFWATWCGPCRMIAPAIEKLAEEYAQRIVVGKVDVDQVSELAEEYGIMSIPAVIFFKDGVEYTRLIGARPYANYAQTADEVLE